MRERLVIGALLALLVLLLFVDRPGSWLFEPDEARYAEVPREMLVAGDLVTPRLNGARYFEKPPLLYWANAAAIAAFGHTPSAVRLATRLAALGTVAALALSLESMLAGWGWWSALVLLSCPLVFALGRYNLTDGLLTLTMTLSFLSLRRFLLRREAGLEAEGALMALGAATALGVLAKGLVALALPGLTLLLWAGIMGRWRRVREALISPAPVIFLALGAPWFVAVERANPGFWRIFFVREHFLRYATPEASRQGPWYYFLGTFLLGFLPWSFLIARAVAPLRPLRMDRWRARPDDLFFFLWFMVIVVFFSASQSKLIPYIFPAFPAAAALAGRAIIAPGARFLRPLLAHALVVTIACSVGLAVAAERGVLAHFGVGALATVGSAGVIAGAWGAVLWARHGGREALWPAVAGWTALYAAIVLALPAVARDLSTHDLAVRAEREGGAVAAYHGYPQGFPWELERPIPVVTERGELGSDGVYPPAFYWSDKQFWERWRAPGHFMAVLPARGFSAFSALAPEGRVLASNAKWVLVGNWPAAAQ